MLVKGLIITIYSQASPNMVKLQTVQYRKVKWGNY